MTHHRGAPCRLLKRLVSRTRQQPRAATAEPEPTGTPPSTQPPPHDVVSDDLFPCWPPPSPRAILSLNEQLAWAASLEHFDHASETRRTRPTSAAYVLLRLRRGLMMGRAARHAPASIETEKGTNATDTGGRKGSIADPSTTSARARGGTIHRRHNRQESASAASRYQLSSRFPGAGSTARRRSVIDSWASFCPSDPTPSVVPMEARQSGLLVELTSRSVASQVDALARHENPSVTDDTIAVPALSLSLSSSSSSCVS
ncbi:hypothetical protein HYQ46_004342 [Verticillium longisporum]|nr:hypothetical protein HYQ46_004342 [Verticillium longisporum]